MDKMFLINMILICSSSLTVINIGVTVVSNLYNIMKYNHRNCNLACHETSSVEYLWRFHNKHLQSVLMFCHSTRFQSIKSGRKKNPAPHKRLECVMFLLSLSNLIKINYIPKHTELETRDDLSYIDWTLQTLDFIVVWL